VRVRLALLALFALATIASSGCRRFGYPELVVSHDAGGGAQDAGQEPDAGGEAGGQGDAAVDGGRGGGGGTGAGGAANGGRGGGAGGTGGMAAGSGGDAGGGAGGSDAGADPPDAGTPDSGTPVDPPDGLIHRYSFNGSGSTACIEAEPAFDLPAAQCAEDSIGARHGRIVNTALTGAGAVEFTGDYWTPDIEQSDAFDATAEYVDLLPNLLADSGVVDLTFFVWFTWEQAFADDDHIYVVHIGSTRAGNNNIQTSFLYVSPNGGGNNDPRAGYQPLIGTRINLGSAARPVGTYCYALRFDDTNDQIALFVNGAEMQNAGLADSDHLATAISDEKNWLGRSPITIDTPFVGSIDEFRVYNVALSNSAIQAHCASPPNTLLPAEP
jgi:hypothetical protein